ncbi:hypothetical protein SAMN05421771_3521 [Granulicella pectinivorans]|uniref:Uncharacterized protein n=1 Tax=Granulicella pectinivorans TaxID=474950 RepID=A0A1I6MSD3_9BACT|nr:hypothetical protein SAMN05421771_3521 [Granulicella pectinivorans]
MFNLLLALAVLLLVAVPCILTGNDAPVARR